MSLALLARMALYFFFPIAAAHGFGSWDAEAGTFTIVMDAEAIAQFIGVNLAGYAATFGLSRYAKAKGGAT